MRGEVLYFDEAQGFGFISGVDGNRYTFAREDLRQASAPARGAEVEFSAGNGKARDVFVLHGETAAAGGPVPAHRPFGRNGYGPENEADTSLWGYFWQAMTTKYARFSGRARRKEYWGFVLFYFVAMAVLLPAALALDAAVGNLDGYAGAPVATIAAMVVLLLAGIIPGIAIMVRRQHDIGLSGWFYLLIFVPYVGGLALFVFALIPSQKHANKWGEVPAGVFIPPPFVPVTPGTGR